MVTKKTTPFRTILSPHNRIYTPSGTKEEDVWEMIVDEKGRETFAITGKVNVYEKTQAFKDSVDLGKIIEKVTLTGDYNILNQRKTEYLDITEMPNNIIEAHRQLQNAKITFENNNYFKSTKTVKVTVKKATPKLTAKDKSFKKSLKTKKYTITLKNNKNKALTKAQVTLKVKGHPAGAKLYLDPDATIDLNKDANNQVLCHKECTYELPLTNENGDLIAAPTATTTTPSKTYGHLLFIPGGSFEYKVEISYKDAANNSYEFKTDYAVSTTQFVAGNKYTLVINKTPDTFIVGKYHDPDDDEEDDNDDFEAGDWKDVSVSHTFN